MTTHYQYDAELAAMLAHVPELDISNIAAARELLAGLAALLPPWQPGPGIKVSEDQAPGLAGAPDVPVFVLTPSAAATTPRPATARLGVDPWRLVSNVSRAAVPVRQQVDVCQVLVRAFAVGR